MADGDDHVLALDQVLVLDLAFHLEDLGAAWGAELGFDGAKLLLDDGDDTGARAQDVEMVPDLGAERLELIVDLVAAERRQALETQIEDGARLLIRQAVGAFARNLVPRIGDQLD